MIWNKKEELEFILGLFFSNALAAAEFISTAHLVSATPDWNTNNEIRCFFLPQVYLSKKNVIS